MNEEAQIADIISDDTKFRSFVAMSIISHGKELKEIKANCERQVCQPMQSRAIDGITISPGMTKKMAMAMIAVFYAILEALKAAVLFFTTGPSNGNNQ